MDIYLNNNSNNNNNNTDKTPKTPDTLTILVCRRWQTVDLEEADELFVDIYLNNNNTNTTGRPRRLIDSRLCSLLVAAESRA